MIKRYLNFLFSSFFFFKSSSIWLWIKIILSFQTFFFIVYKVFVDSDIRIWNAELNFFHVMVYRQLSSRKRTCRLIVAKLSLLNHKTNLMYKHQLNKIKSQAKIYQWFQNFVSIRSSRSSRSSYWQKLTVKIYIKIFLKF